MKAYDKQFIGGVWREGRGRRVLEDRDPYSGEVLCRYRSAGPEDLDDAYAAARAAQKAWFALAPARRVEALERLWHVMDANRALLDECLLREAGCTAPKRAYEVGESVNLVRYYMTFPYLLDGKIQESDNPGQMNYIFRRPRGVVTVIAPWNVPFILALRSVLPAVATGNAVVLKPASDTPATALILGELFEKAGMPAGLLNVVAGSGDEIGDALVLHPMSDMVSFTGSTEVGKRIGSLAGSRICDVSLELGGNNAMLLLPDADLEKAAEKAVFGAFFHQGQICMGLNRIITLPENHEDFCRLFAEKVRALKAGDPSDPEVFVGPLINAGQVRRFEALLEETRKAGARVLVEGRTEGSVVHPWVLTEVTMDMPAACSEMFGPVVSILRAKDVEEMIALANGTEYGLSGSVFGRDVYRAMQIARRLESGMVHINDQSIGDEAHVMFGGEKQSGVGRFNGDWVLRKFTTEQWLAVSSE